MPILVKYTQSGVTEAQYDRIRQITDWENHPPHGAIFHAVGFKDGAIYVSDVWETETDLDDYTIRRLLPAIEEVGLTMRPPEVIDLYRVAAYARADRYRLKSDA